MLKFILIFLFFKYCVCEVNNVCRNFKDYYTIKDNPNCYFNYAVNQLVPEIIKLGGLPFEEHKVTTNDGYILTLHRIPNKDHPNPKNSPMFLQHGLVTTSGNFVALRNESIAFMLANSGYDVWLGNYRGNQYSDEHVNLTAYDFQYWNHCLDEIANQDIPTFLNYISKITGKKGEIIYIGHSLGTTDALMFASATPEQAKSLVKLFILLAPAYTLSNMVTPIKNLGYGADLIYDTIKRFELVRLVSHEKATKPTIKMICLESPILMETCFTVLRSVYGPNTKVKPDILPIFFDQHPSGSSIRIIKQVADFISKPFGKFDYGFENYNYYGRMTPPEYNLKKIQVPIHIITSPGDWLTSMKDAFNLFNNLPPKARHGIYVVPSEYFNHIDYVFGTDAKVLVNDYIIKYIDDFNV